MRKAFAIIVLLSLNISLFAQRNTYLGVETNFTRGQYSLSDPGYNIRFINDDLTDLGLNIRQEFSKIISVELGITSISYTNSTDLHSYQNEGVSKHSNLGNSEQYYSRLKYSSAYQFPLRIKAKFNLFNSPLSVTPSIGYRFSIVDGIQDDVAWFDSTHVSQATNGSFTYLNTVDDRSIKYFSQIEAGLSFEYCLKNDMIISLNTRYITNGGGYLIKENIEYGFANQAKEKATLINKGDAFSVGIEVSYPISKIWQRKSTETSPTL